MKSIIYFAIGLLLTDLCLGGVKLNAQKSQKHFELDKPIILRPEESVKGPDGLIITHMGYGHKFGGGPNEDYSFFLHIYTLH